MARRRAKPQPPEDRRRELMEAALRLMADRGFAGTSVDDIAREARVAKGTVYLYFPSKEALLEAIFEQQSLLPELMPALERLGQAPSLEAAVRALVPAVWEALKQRRRAIELLLREGGVHGKEFVQRIVPANETLAELLRDRLPAAKRERIDAFVAVRMLLVSLLGLFIQQEIWAGSEAHPVDDETVTGSIAEIFLRGVLG